MDNVTIDIVEQVDNVSIDITEQLDDVVVNITEQLDDVSINIIEQIDNVSIDITEQVDNVSVSIVDNVDEVTISVNEGLYIDEITDIVESIMDSEGLISDVDYVHTDNNYTDADVLKLSNIEEGADVNVQSDWNAISGDSFINNKPTIPASQVNSDWNSITGVSEILNKPTIPVASDFNHDDLSNITGTSGEYNHPTNANMTVLGNTSGTNTGDQNLSGLVPYTGATTDVSLGAHNLIVDTDTLFINSIGHYVGIGIATPTSKLHVAGKQILSYGVPSGALSIGADVNLTTRSTNVRKLGVIAGIDYTNTKNIELFTTDSVSTVSNLVYFGGRNGGSSYAATHIYFTTAPNTSTTGGTTRMFINNSGRVGINTVSPASLLTIIGSSGTITDGLTFNTAGTIGIYIDGSNNLTFTDTVTGTKTLAELLGASLLETQKFKLSSLNTAPSSSTDTGILGEIRITADYIYVCTATNTWKRTALTTW